MTKNLLLKKLECEAISIIRDSFSKSLNPVMMYSIRIFWYYAIYYINRI